MNGWIDGLIDWLMDRWIDGWMFNATAVQKLISAIGCLKMLFNLKRDIFEGLKKLRRPSITNEL